MTGREHVIAAADRAAWRGALPPTPYRALMALLSFTDDPAGPSRTPTMAELARAVHGPRYATATGGARTAARWVADLEARCWVHRCHRSRTFRVTIPAPAIDAEPLELIASA